jgi:23S rRNA (guanosine2251-2'-O)-methyltransferase
VADVVGIQAARAVLRDDAGRARCLYLQRGRRDARFSELIALAKETAVRFQTMDATWFKRRQQDAAHQGVILDCQELEIADEGSLRERWPELPDVPLVLILDGITDPRNLGACLRSANGAHVDVVILPKRRSAPLNEAALKTAQGGAENLFIVNVTNFARTLEWLKAQGLWIIGADDTANMAWHEMDARVPVAVVVGSEGKGLRRLTKEHCDQLVAIPMLGSVSSLNVSVAAGILLFEAVRQRSL